MPTMADDIANQYLSGGSPEPDADDAKAQESPGKMLLKAIAAKDATGIEAAVRACMETGAY